MCRRALESKTGRVFTGEREGNCVFVSVACSDYEQGIADFLEKITKLLFAGAIGDIR